MIKNNNNNKTMYTGDAQACYPEKTELIHIKSCSDQDI